jgi:hypothetical protein
VVDPILIEEEFWTIKLLSPFPMEESKRRLTLILQPTKARTGFHTGLLGRFYLKDTTSNL